MWISHATTTDFVYMNTEKMIGLKRKRHDFYFTAESRFQESVSKQNFYACARPKKKWCRRDIPVAFRLA